eukprot:TRINITY_DN10_c0_g2_i3.p1 TRINITY_DN10_c0_g2~~TRINITY_DN10_c0_g2_i3.p1  ORF type:complete len:529 (-),score=95.54 TRINITY_DN10_c0_g2_i3:747-2288(-)
MCIRDRYQRRVRGQFDIAMATQAAQVVEPELQVVQGDNANYELGPTLGKGKFGKVKGAVNTETGHRVAVKIIKKALAIDGGDSAEVAREVRCLKAIDHPNVLKLHDVVETKDRLYIVLDLARGGDFFEYILSLYGDGHAFSEEEGRAYLRQLINGVDACHSVGIAHRDLKPENLLLREMMQYGQIPPEGTLMISDFGLSNWFRTQQDGTQTTLGTPCGSTKYAAPEIIQGKGMYAPSAIDIWSCGIIVYIMFAGQFPFTEATAKCELFVKYNSGHFTWPDHFGPDLVQLLSGMLTIEPTKRWTIAQIKQSNWWLEGLGAELSEEFSCVDMMEEDGQHMSRELFGHLPTAMELVDGTTAMEEELEEQVQIQYRSVAVPDPQPKIQEPTNQTTQNLTDNMTKFTQLKNQAAKLRCSQAPECTSVRQIEEEMAALFSRASIERLADHCSIETSRTDKTNESDSPCKYSYAHPHRTDSYAHPHRTDSYAHPHRTDSYAHPHRTDSYAHPHRTVWCQC